MRRTRNILEKLENAEAQAQEKLADMLERMQRCKERSKDLEQAVIDAANAAESKQHQVAAVSKMIDTTTAQNGDPILWLVTAAVKAAADKAEEVQSIIFSGRSSCMVVVFCPGEYTVEDKMRAAEKFLGGGTNFQTPMTQAVQLIQDGGFQNADIVFITDGECHMAEDYLLELRRSQAALGFTVTGVLLDKDSPGMDFSLKSFCRDIYRTSELVDGDLVRELVSKRV